MTEKRNTTRCAEVLLSVVVPNYNGSRFIRGCLESLLSQEIDGGLEIIVVDDCSTDDSAEIIGSEFSRVVLIRNDANAGFVASANRGLEAATGEFVAIVNNDVTAAPGWAQAACRAMREDDNIGAVACKILSAADRSIIDSAGQKYLPVGWAGRIGCGEKDGPKFAGRRQVFGPTGTASFFRREVLEKTGLYEEFFESYYEDADLNYRINRLGRTCVYEPRSVAFHLGSASYSSDRVAYYGSRNVEYMFFLNSSLAALIIFFVPHMAFDFVHLISRTVRRQMMPFLRGKGDFLKNLRALSGLRRERKRRLRENHSG